MRSATHFFSSLSFRISNIVDVSTHVRLSRPCLLEDSTCCWSWSAWRREIVWREFELYNSPRPYITLSVSQFNNKASLEFPTNNHNHGRKKERKSTPITTLTTHPTQHAHSPSHSQLRFSQGPISRRLPLFSAYSGNLDPEHHVECLQLTD